VWGGGGSAGDYEALGIPLGPRAALAGARAVAELVDENGVKYASAQALHLLPAGFLEASAREAAPAAAAAAAAVAATATSVILLMKLLIEAIY